MTDMPQRLEEVQEVFEQMLADDHGGHSEDDHDTLVEDAKVQTVHFYQAWQNVQERRQRSE